MASDRTFPKQFGFVVEAGSPDALIPCPTCTLPMAVDMLHALAAVDDGRLPCNRTVRWAEASHTIPSSEGGRRIALECNVCNRARGNATWDTDRPTYAEGKRAAYRANVARVRASRERLSSLGYVDR